MSVDLFYRFEAETGIVPHTYSGCPLKQVVDSGVATTIVEVLCIEGTFYGTLGEVNHGHRPVLSTVGSVIGFSHNAGIVLTAITITEREFCVPEGVDAVGSIGIEAILSRLVDTECRCILCAGFGHRNERERTICLAAHGYLGTVGRHEHYGTTHLALKGLYLPQLSLVRTVVLTYPHLIAIGTKRLIGKGVDDAHTTREVGYCPVLSLS